MPSGAQHPCIGGAEQFRGSTEWLERRGTTLTARGALLTVWLGVCACASPSVGADAGRCDVALTTEFDPVPREAEPTWGPPSDLVVTPPTYPIVYVQAWLPWGLGSRSVYPVAFGDDVPLRLLVAVGAGDPTEAVTSIALVEGRPSEVLVDGERRSRIEISLEGGLGMVELVVPPDALAPGLNRIDFAHFLARRGGRRLFVGTSFTVANGSLEPVPFVETPGLEEGTYVPGQRTQVYRTSAATPELGEIYFPQWVPAAAPLDDPTAVIVRLQASSPWSGCSPENEDRMVVLAFRDMEPVPMGGVERVAVSLPPGEQRVFRFDLPLFPEDGMQHHYGLVLLGGFGRPARSVDGALGPWVIRRDLLQVFWGWNPEEG